MTATATGPATTIRKAPAFIALTPALVVNPAEVRGACYRVRSDGVLITAYLVGGVRLDDLIAATEDEAKAIIGKLLPHDDGAMDPLTPEEVTGKALRVLHSKLAERGIMPAADFFRMVDGLPPEHDDRPGL